MTGHLLSSTVAALIAVALAWALRRQGAGLRHAVLLAAVLRFAVPTGWLMEAGSTLARRLPAPSPIFAGEDLSRLLLSPGTDAFHAAPARDPHVLWLIWAFGSAVCLALWIGRLRWNIPAVREPNAEEIGAFLDAQRRLPVGARVELRIAASDHVPCAFGWRRPLVIVPHGLAEQLTAAELEAVMAHELAHVRRRDNLSAALVRAIISVFWFHPLLWWIERRMLAERERACDEMVLVHGARAEDYVGGILKVCRMAFAGPAGYAGATGSNLKLRMEQIMSATIVYPSSRPIRAALGVLAAAVVFIPIGAGFLRAQTAEVSKADSTRLKQSKALMDAKQYDEARAVLQEILQADANSADALFQMGMLNLSEEKYAQAEEFFRRTDQLEPANTRGLMGVVEVYMAQKRDEEALPLLQAGLAKLPESVATHLAVGNVAVRVKKYDLAIAEYQQALNIAGKESQTAGNIYLRLGETYRRKGDLPSAITALEQAKMLLPGNAMAVNTLALTLDTAGKRQEARQAYEEVLKLDPRNGVALNNLAFLLSQDGGDRETALKYVKRAQALLPNLTEVSDTLGWVYMKKGQTSDAIDVFQDVVRADPSNSNFRYHLAMALLQNGDRSGAQREAKAALQLNPPQKEAEEIRQFLLATQ